MFGPRIIYGSLQESDYIGFLRGTSECHDLSYENSIRKYGLFGELKMLYADVLISPFGEVFDLIIINSLPYLVSVEEGFIKELDRLLKTNGLLVVEDVKVGVDAAGDVIYDGDDQVSTDAVEFGFAHVTSEVNLASLTYLTSEPPAWSSGKKYATSSLGGWLVDKSEFEEVQKKGGSGKIFAEEIRIFRKRGAIARGLF